MSEWLAPSPGLFVESAGSGCYYPQHMAEDKLRQHLDVYLGKVEVGIYCVLARPALAYSTRNHGERG